MQVERAQEIKYKSGRREEKEAEEKEREGEGEGERREEGSVLCTGRMRGSLHVLDG